MKEPVEFRYPLTDIIILFIGRLQLRIIGLLRAATLLNSLVTCSGSQQLLQFHGFNQSNSLTKSSIVFQSKIIKKAFRIIGWLCSEAFLSIHYSHQWRGYRLPEQPPREQLAKGPASEQSSSIWINHYNNLHLQTGAQAN